MKLITRDTDYAVRALAYIAKNYDNRVSVTDLVDELKIPRPFLRKILQLLTKKGIVRSCKGKGGGFVLVKDPEDILLMTLMEVFQGPFKLNECFFKKKNCPDKNRCVLKKKIDDMERWVIKELDSITLASLVKKGD